jgi:ABC-2 type transport system permease protein
VRLYLEVARRSFARHLTYRAATLAGLFTNTVFGVMISAVYTAFFRGREESAVAGFTLTDALSYVWLGQSLISVIAIWGTWEIAASIRSGDIVTDLTKPMSYYGYWLSHDLGRAACHALTRLLPTFLIGWLLFDLAPAASAGAWIGFALCTGLAVTVSFGWRFLLNLSAFWLLDIKGAHLIALGLVEFFSGFLVPLAFFPPWLLAIAEVLPFRAIMMAPVEVYLGQRGILSAALLQLFWAIALMVACQLALAAAVRKVVIQGG